MLNQTQAQDTTANRAAEMAKLRPHDIHCFQVVRTCPDIFHRALSPLYQTLEQAEARLAEVIDAAPDARVSWQGFIFYSENDQGRHELLAEIVKAEQLEPQQ